MPILAALTCLGNDPCEIDIAPCGTLQANLLLTVATAIHDRRGAQTAALYRVDDERVCGEISRLDAARRASFSRAMQTELTKMMVALVWCAKSQGKAELLV